MPPTVDIENTETSRKQNPGGEEINYPESDGKPMADNTLQFRYIAALKNGFDALYLEQDNVFVAGDLLWYPVQGDPKIRYTPDVMIAIGRPKGDRGSYLQWEENDQPPDVAIEVLSPGNSSSEMNKKREAYERHGVNEYYEYDPNRGTLKGWIRDGSGDTLAPISSMDHWKSPTTEVTFHLDEKDLIVTRPDGKQFLDSEQTEEEIVAQTKRADEAEDANQKLIAQLRAAGIEPDI